jgi:hypothetical protein
MHSDEDQQEHQNGNLPSARDVKQEPGNLGAAWIRRGRRIRDGKSSLDTKKEDPAREPQADSQAESKVLGKGAEGNATE